MNSSAPILKVFNYFFPAQLQQQLLTGFCLWLGLTSSAKPVLLLVKSSRNGYLLEIKEYYVIVKNELLSSVSLLSLTGFGSFFSFSLAEESNRRSGDLGYLALYACHEQGIR